jgi:hypothetical protein
MCPDESGESSGGVIAQVRFDSANQKGFKVNFE